MGKAKRTRKFKKNHLQKAIVKRKIVQNIKRRERGTQEKRQARHAKAKAEAEETAAAAAEIAKLPKPKATAPAKKLPLDLESFLQANFGADDVSIEQDVLLEMPEEDDVMADTDEDEGEDEDEDQEEEEDEDQLDGDLGDEIKAHKQQLEELKQSDPEFYKHLMENDASLLDFGNEEDSEEVEEEEEEVKPIQTEKKKQKSEKRQQKRKLTTKEKNQATIRSLSIPFLKKLYNQVLEKKSLAALKRLLVLFRTCCHVGDEDAKVEYNVGLKITNGKIFNSIMRFCLKNMGTIFDRQLNRGKSQPEEEEKNGKDDKKGKDKKKDKDKKDEAETTKKPSHAKKWSHLLPCVKSFLGHLLHFMGQSSDDLLQRYILNSLEPLVDYLVCFPKYTKRFMKHLLQTWQGDESNARIDAFLRIRQVALSSEEMYVLALQGLYLAYARGCGVFSGPTEGRIIFMVNCIVEMFGLDPVSGFQHGFVYVRQLAMHVRNAIKEKTKRAHKTVLHWQFVNCLRVWSQVLCTHALKKDSLLHGLIYPFVQVCMSTLDLAPSFRYTPLKYHIIEFLHKIMADGTFLIPLAPHILAVFGAAEFTKAPAKSTQFQFQLDYSLHASEAVSKTRAYQESISGRAFELLQEHYTHHSYSVAYPELIIPTLFALKKIKKNTRLRFVKTQVTQLMGKLEMNSTFIKNLRSQIDYAPKDMKADGVSFKTLILSKDPKTVSVLDRYSDKQVADESEEEEEEEQEVEAQEQKQVADDDEGDDDDDDSSMDEQDDEGAEDQVMDLVLSDDDDDSDDNDDDNSDDNDDDDSDDNDDDNSDDNDDESDESE